MRLTEQEYDEVMELYLADKPSKPFFPFLAELIVKYNRELVEAEEKKLYDELVEELPIHVYMQRDGSIDDVRDFIESRALYLLDSIAEKHRSTFVSNLEVNLPLDGDTIELALCEVNFNIFNRVDEMVVDYIDDKFGLKY